MSNASTTKQIAVGKIGPAFGVRGWVHVHSFTSPIDNLLNYPSWRLRIKSAHSGEKEFKLEEGRVHGRGLAVKLEGCDDRDAATLLRGSEIIISREALPALAQDEFYWSDLEGLQVKSESDSKLLGVVDYLYEAGANDVMVVLNRQQREHIPFVFGDVVKSVDLDLGVIVVDWVVVE